MEQAEKATVWLRKTERVESIRIKHDGKLRFYAHTYFVLDRGRWKPVARWDNLDSIPHVDRYDEGGNLVESKPCQAKSLKEVVSVVSIFRRNLVAMDLAEL